MGVRGKWLEGTLQRAQRLVHPSVAGPLEEYDTDEQRKRDFTILGEDSAQEPFVFLL